MGSDRADDPVSGAPAGTRRDYLPWLLAATILGSSMVFIDGSAVGVALPILQTDLGTRAAGVQWVVETSTLLLGTLILVGGSLGDYYGRRLVFSIGVALFAAGSVWSGAAPNLGHVIAGRALTGLGGALLVPNSLALIGATFRGAERGRAVGTWSSLTSAAIAVAPVLGGWLVETISWRAVFFLNLPLAAAVLAIALSRVPTVRGEEAGRRLDLPAALLAVLGLGGLVFGLVEGPSRGGGDPLILAAYAVGALSLTLFVWRELRATSPMVPPELFRSPTFTGVNVLTLLVYAGLNGVLFYLPFNLIQVQGYSATAAGAAVLPVVILLTLLSRWSGGLIARTGARLPLVVGPALAGLGMAAFALPGVGGSYWTTFFLPNVLLGLGMAVTVAPLTATVLGSVPRASTGVASGVNNTAARVAALLGIAVLGVVISRGFVGRLETNLAEMDVPEEAVDAVMERRDELAAAEPPNDLDEATRAEMEAAIDGAYVYGFRLAMVAAGALSLAGAAVAWRTVEAEGRGRNTDGADGTNGHG